MKNELAVVPKGIFGQLQKVSSPLYVLLNRGFTGPEDQFDINELCQRCQRGEKTLRRAITLGRSLGWIRSWRACRSEVLYSRHAPGPYITVLDPLVVDPNRTAHKVALLVQLDGAHSSIYSLATTIGVKKSSVYSAISELCAIGFTTRLGLGWGLSLSSRQEFHSLNLLNKSMRASSLPKKATGFSKKAVSQVYDSWVSTGCPSLDSYSRSDAAYILMHRFSYLCSAIENVRCVPTGMKIADISNVLRWLESPVDFGCTEGECQRVLRITSGAPYQTALLAVDSLFTKSFSGFTFEFNVLFKCGEDKNNFDRFVIGSYLKSLKDPDWRDELTSTLNRIKDTESAESYDEFKSRLLGQ